MVLGACAWCSLPPQAPTPSTKHPAPNTRHQTWHQTTSIKRGTKHQAPSTKQHAPEARRRAARTTSSSNPLTHPHATRQEGRQSKNGCKTPAQSGNTTKRRAATPNDTRGRGLRESRISRFSFPSLGLPTIPLPFGESPSYLSAPGAKAEGSAPEPTPNVVGPKRRLETECADGNLQRTAAWAWAWAWAWVGVGVGGGAVARVGAGAHRRTCCAVVA